MSSPIGSSVHSPRASSTTPASDVAYLLELAERQAAEIESTGRREWFDVAMADLLAKPRGARNPTDAWRRIKEVRHLRGTDLAVAQAIAAWRERRAQELDLTPRFVLSDLGVVGLAVAKPASIEQIRDVRGCRRSPVSTSVTSATISSPRSPRATSRRRSETPHGTRTRCRRRSRRRCR